MKTKICPDLLCTYVRIIAMMSQARSVNTADLYRQIDKRRAEIHDQIATQAGVPRDNTELLTFLNSIVMMYLDEKERFVA